MKHLTSLALPLCLLFCSPLITSCEDDEAPTVGSDHPGYEVPDCKSCHTGSHNQEALPVQCASCHGTNGAPHSHGEENCEDCHASEIAWHGPEERFPLTSCLGCHVP